MKNINNSNYKMNEDSYNQNPNKNECQMRIETSKMPATETILGMSKKTAFTVFVWSFRLAALFLVFLLWQLVIAPIIPIVTPFLEAIFVTQETPITYSGGQVLIGGLSIFDIRTIIFGSLLKFIVLTTGLIVLKKLKIFLCRAIFM